MKARMRPEEWGAPAAHYYLDKDIKAPMRLVANERLFLCEACGQPAASTAWNARRHKVCPRARPSKLSTKTTGGKNGKANKRDTGRVLQMPGDAVHRNAGKPAGRVPGTVLEMPAITSTEQAGTVRRGVRDMKNSDEIVNNLPIEQRKKVEERAAQLITDEMTLQVGWVNEEPGDQMSSIHEHLFGIIAVPNELRDAINAAIDAVIKEFPDAEGERADFYDSLLAHYDKHGVIPEFKIVPREAL